MENKRVFIKSIAFLHICIMILTSILPVCIMLKSTIAEAQDNLTIQNIRENLVMVENNTDLEKYDLYANNEFISKNEIERIGLNSYKICEGVEFYILPKEEKIKDYRVRLVYNNETKKEYVYNANNIEPISINLTKEDIVTLFIEEKQNTTSNKYEIVEKKEITVEKNVIYLENATNANIKDEILYVIPNQQITLSTKWAENEKNNLATNGHFYVGNITKSDSWKFEGNKLISPNETNNEGILEWKNENGASVYIKIKTSNSAGNTFEITSKKVEKYSKFYTFNKKEYLTEIEIGAEYKKNTEIKMKLNNYSAFENLNINKKDIKVEDCNGCLHNYDIITENDTYRVIISAKQEGVIKITYTNWEGVEQSQYWHICLYDNNNYTNSEIQNEYTIGKSISKIQETDEITKPEYKENIKNNKIKIKKSKWQYNVYQTATILTFKAENTTEVKYGITQNLEETIKKGYKEFKGTKEEQKEFSININIAQKNIEVNKEYCLVVWGYNQETKEDNYSYYKVIFKDTLPPSIDISEDNEINDNKIRKFNIVSEQVVWSKLEEGYYYIEKKAQPAEYVEPSIDTIKQKGKSFVEKGLWNAKATAEINSKITGSGYYDLTVYVKNTNKSYTINYISNINVNVVDVPKISYSIKGEDEREASTIKIEDNQTIYLKVSDKNKDKNNNITVNYFWSNEDYTKNGTVELSKKLFENNEKVQTFTVKGDSEDNTEIINNNLKDENQYLYVQAIDMHGNCKYLRSGSIRVSSARKLESLYVENVEKEEKERKYNTNYEPEFYGTIGATIRVGDKFDIKNSYYRILAKDFEDGNITNKIILISNNVDTSKPGEYSVTYAVNDSDENLVTIDVPIIVVADQNANIKLQRKLYDFSNEKEILDTMNKTGFKRGNLHDSQSLGIYLKNNGTIKIKNLTELNENLDIKFLNNDQNTEPQVVNIENGEYSINVNNAYATIKNAQGTIIKTVEPNIRNDEQEKTEDGEVIVDDVFDGVTQVVADSDVIYDTVPFIITPKETSNVVVEIELIDGVEPLDYFTYGDLVENNKGEKVNPDFASLQNKFLLLEGSRASILVPELDYGDLGDNIEDNPNGSFKNFEELLKYYDELIEKYDEWVGLSYNAEEIENKNVKTKYFIKANKHGHGYAYYGRNGEIAMNAVELGPLICPNKKYNAEKNEWENGIWDLWTIFHEVGHGYQGGLKSYELALGEISNNWLAHYYEKAKLGTSALENDIEKWSIEEDAINRLKNKTLYLQEKSGDLNPAMYILYAYINLFNKKDYDKTIADLYKYYRKVKNEEDNILNDSDNKTRATDIITEAISDSQKYNVIPYFEYWGVTPSLNTRREVNKKDYPIVYPVIDLVSSKEQAEIIKNDLGQEWIHTVATNEELKKYNLSGSAQITINDNLFNKIKNSKILIKSGTEVVKSIKVTEKQYDIQLPIGVYEIECSKEGVEFDCEYLIIKENVKNEVTINENEIKSIKIFKQPNNFVDSGHTYILGDSVDVSGGIIEVTTNAGIYYVDMTDKEIKLIIEQIWIGDLIPVEGTKFNNSGMYNVKLQYRDKEIEWNYSVDKYSEKGDKSLGIYVRKNPSKIEYKLGEDLSISDGSILYLNEELTTRDGMRQAKGYAVSLSDSEVIISGYDKNRVGIQNVKISYKGYETYIQVNVVKEEEQANITKKKVYNIGDEIKITAQFTHNIENQNTFHNLYIKAGDGQEIKQDSYEIIGNKVIYHYLITDRFISGDLHIVRFGKNEDTNQDTYITEYTNGINGKVLNKIEGKYYINADVPRMELLEIAITTDDNTQIREENNVKYIKNYKTVQIVGQYNDIIKTPISLMVSKGNIETNKIMDFDENRLFFENNTYDIVDITEYLNNTNDKWEGDLNVYPFANYQNNKNSQVALNNYNIIYSIDGVKVENGKVVFDNYVSNPEIYISDNNNDEQINKEAVCPKGTEISVFAEFDKSENSYDCSGIDSIKLTVENNQEEGTLEIQSKDGEVLNSDNNVYNLESTQLPLKMKANNDGNYKITAEKTDKMNNTATNDIDLTIKSKAYINKEKSGLETEEQGMLNLYTLQNKRYILRIDIGEINPRDIIVKIDNIKTPAQYLGKERDSSSNTEYAKYTFDVNKGGKYNITVLNTNGKKLISDFIMVDNVYRIGDVNRDGIIDAIDQICILKYIARLVDYSDIGIQYSGDINGEDGIDVSDVVLLAKYVCEDPTVISTADGHFATRKD